MTKMISLLTGSSLESGLVMETNKYLSELYYDPSNVSSYASVEKLYNEAKQKLPNVTLKEIKEWLSEQRTYTLHKPARRKFTRNKYLVQRIDELWQIDLADMVSVSSSNNGYKYILTVIDVLSKYAFGEPLKTKKPLEVVKALRKIFRDRKPTNIQSDKGKEFVNRTVKEYFKKEKINHYVSHNDEVKCAIVERFNRTLKTKIFKYFTAKNTYKYIDVLQNFIATYNNTVHRSIKMKPSEVTLSTQQSAFSNLYGGKTMREMLQERQSPKLLDGDIARVSKVKGKFEKGYLPNWSEELFKIRKAKTMPGKVQYKLTDWDGEHIKGSFYPEEIQKVKVNNTTQFKIEAILESRKRGRKTEYFVKWLGYPDKFNSWIESRDLLNEAE